MISRSLFVESKKLRVFDFDDTLVFTNSFIYIKRHDGSEFKLTPGVLPFASAFFIAILKSITLSALVNPTSVADFNAL